MFPSRQDGASTSHLTKFSQCFDVTGGSTGSRIPVVFFCISPRFVIRVRIRVSHLARWARTGSIPLCDTDQPVVDGPMGPSVTLGPVGLGGTSSQCKPYQLVADGPVGSTEELGLVGTRGKLLRIDIKTVVMTDELANSIGTSPSSDSGIHSLGEQWEDTSLITTDTEEEQYRTSQIHTPTGRRVSDTCVPPHTEEDQVTLCPWIDCLLNRKSDESPEIDMLDSDSDSEWNESEEFYSDQELTTDESSYADYETWTYAKNTTGMRDPVDPPVTSKLHKVSSAEQYEDKSSVYGETDGGNSDICNLADFSSEDEDIPVERYSGSQSVNMIGVDLIDGMTPMEYVPIPRESRQNWPKEIRYNKYIDRSRVNQISRTVLRCFTQNLPQLG